MEFIEFQEPNELIDNRSAIDRLIEEHVILQNAEEVGQELTEEEIDEIEARVKIDMEKDSDSTNKILKEFNMNYNEFLEFYTEIVKKYETILKWNNYITDQINEGKIKIENEEFNSKYNEYQNSKDISNRYRLLLEMESIYKDYLKDKAITENKN